ncbi:MAG: CvpA family protein [Burkholderiales bacterium]
MTLFDWAVILVIGLSSLLGLMRGAIREVLALAGWVIAFLVAREYGVAFSAMLTNLVANDSIRLALAFASLFFATLVLMALLRMTVTELVKKIGLGGADKFFGLLIGMARGVLIVLVIVMLAGMTELPQQPDWKKAYSSRWFEIMVENLKPWLPEGLARRINFGFIAT